MLTIILETSVSVFEKSKDNGINSIRIKCGKKKTSGLKCFKIRSTHII